MGLDWCLKSKVRAGYEDEHKKIIAKLEKLSEDSKAYVVVGKNKLGQDKYEESAEHKALSKRLDEITISAGETLGAPRIGIDQKATEWFRTNNYEPMRERAAAAKATFEAEKAELARLNSFEGLSDVTLVKERRETLENSIKYANETFMEYWTRPFEEVVKDEYGKYVVDLVNYDLSTCTGMISSAVDFRGKCVGYSDWITHELQEEAYEDHDGAESLDYGKRLIQTACDQLRRAYRPKLGKLANDQILAMYDELSAKQREEAKKARDTASPSENPWYDALPEYQQSVLEAWAAFDGGRWLLFWGERGHGYHAWS